MSGENVKYHHNVMTGFDNGCLMDIRVRLACDFIKSSPVFDRSTMAPEEIATAALDLADEVMSQAESRGWIEPLPDTADLNAAMKKHARRQGAWQVYQQLGMQAASKEEAPQVVPAHPSVIRQQ